MTNADMHREHAAAAVFTAHQTPPGPKRQRLYAQAYAFTALAVDEARLNLPAPHESDRGPAEAVLVETQCWQAFLGVAAGLPLGHA